VKIIIIIFFERERERETEREKQREKQREVRSERTIKKRRVWLCLEFYFISLPKERGGGKEKK